MSEHLKKILLVDDNEDSLDMLELFLYQSYDIKTASNGLEGFDKALTTIPDIIITDIIMSELDGIAFFNKLKTSVETKDIPVIVVTAFTKNHSIKSLLNIGFNDVILKPISRIDIIKSISKVLEQIGKKS